LSAFSNGNFENGKRVDDTQLFFSFGRSSERVSAHSDRERRISKSFVFPVQAGHVQHENSHFRDKFGIPSFLQASSSRDDRAQKNRCQLVDLHRRHFDHRSQSGYNPVGSLSDGPLLDKLRFSHQLGAISDYTTAGDRMVGSTAELSENVNFSSRGGRLMHCASLVKSC